MFLDLQIKVLMAKERIKQFFTDESGAVDIVTIVVLIGIAVVLAVIFRDQIASLLDQMFGTLEQQADSALTNTANPSGP